MAHAVRASFRLKVVPVEIKNLVIAHELSTRDRNQEKYRQIAASIAAVGVIEPIVIFPLEGGKYRILDGGKRLDILNRRGAKQVECIIATDDEGYTYNRRVNYLSPVGEHQMIIRALGHNSEERIAEALNVDVSTIRKKRDLIEGICKEAIEILKNSRVTSMAFATLKKMKPIRQIEAAQLMIASNVYSGRFALALLAGTGDDMLAAPGQDRSKRVLSADQKSRMERETDSLIKHLRVVESSYGTEVLTLSVACRYVERVLASDKIRNDLRKRYPEILRELELLLATKESDSRPV